MVYYLMLSVIVMLKYLLLNLLLWIVTIELCEQVNPLANSDEHGMDIYLHCLHFVRPAVGLGHLLLIICFRSTTHIAILHCLNLIIIMMSCHYCITYIIFSCEQLKVFLVNWWRLWFKACVVKQWLLIWLSMLLFIVKGLVLLCCHGR